MPRKLSSSSSNASGRSGTKKRSGWPSRKKCFRPLLMSLPGCSSARTTGSDICGSSTTDRLRDVPCDILQKGAPGFSTGAPIFFGFVSPQPQWAQLPTGELASFRLRTPLTKYPALRVVRGVPTGAPIFFGYHAALCSFFYFKNPIHPAVPGAPHTLHPANRRR